MPSSLRWAVLAHIAAATAAMAVEAVVSPAVLQDAGSAPDVHECQAAAATAVWRETVRRLDRLWPDQPVGVHAEIEANLPPLPAGFPSLPTANGRALGSKSCAFFAKALWHRMANGAVAGQVAPWLDRQRLLANPHKAIEEGSLQQALTKTMASAMRRGGQMDEHWKPGPECYPTPKEARLQRNRRSKQTRATPPVAPTCFRSSNLAELPVASEDRAAIKRGFDTALVRVQDDFGIETAVLQGFLYPLAATNAPEVSEDPMSEDPDADGDDGRDQGYKVHYQPPPRDVEAAVYTLVKALFDLKVEYKMVKPQAVWATYSDPPWVSHSGGNMLFGKMFTLYTADSSVLQQLDAALRGAGVAQGLSATDLVAIPPWDCLVVSVVADAAGHQDVDKDQEMAADEDGGRRRQQQQQHAMGPGWSVRYGVHKAGRDGLLDTELLVMNKGGQCKAASGAGWIACPDGNGGVSTEHDRRPDGFAGVSALARRRCACRPDFVDWDPKGIALLCPCAESVWQGTGTLQDALAAAQEADDRKWKDYAAAFEGPGPAV